MLVSINYEYSQKSPDNEFWREIGVSIDRISEMSFTEMYPVVQTIFERKSVKELKELTTLYGLDVKEKKEDLVSSLLTLQESSRREILILNDFQNRRKQTINKYYKEYFSKSDTRFTSSSLTKLKHLLSDTPITMVEIYALYSWDIKGSGDLYTYEKGISRDDAHKIPTEYRKTVIDTLFKGTGQKSKFKVFAYHKTAAGILVILYKQINDAPRADFDKALRNKEVVPLMFSVNTEDKIIEVKSATQTDKTNLIKYFKDNFDECYPIPIKLNVFDKYDKNEVINSFIKGSPNEVTKVDDFIVNKIVFRESPIKNSPKVTLELENEEIWPSVTYAHINNCVNIESLKDIESLSIKSEGKSRVVRSILLDNGNVVFTMDDSRLDGGTRKKIYDKFSEKFGIPMNQEIANTKFKAGEADKVDYLLGLSMSTTLDEKSREALEKLIKDKIIGKIPKEHFFCPECKLDKELSGTDLPEECPECGYDKLKRKSYEEQVVNNQAIKVHIKKSLAHFSEFQLSPSESNIVFDDDKLKFLKLESNETDEIIQILITDQSLSIKMLNRIKTMMTPTIVIFVGHLEKNIESYNSDCIQAVTFGNIYVKEERLFPSFYSSIYGKLKFRQKSFVSNAASIAEASLIALETSPSMVDSSYTDKKFEDDVYAILKDIFANSEKWGKEASGKALPEGIFAISYMEKGPVKTERKRVFSYDCKFTRKNSGYELNRGEQRKAVEYVETLNQNDIIQSFSDIQELTGHIFISNKFKESQVDNVKKYFYDQLNNNSNAKPIFLSLDALLYLYRAYRENHEQITNASNLFHKELVKLLSKENIDTKDIDSLIKKVINKNVGEYTVLDTKSVSDYLDE
jgi:hypothetical protein